MYQNIKAQDVNEKKIYSSIKDQDVIKFIKELCSTLEYINDVKMGHPDELMEYRNLSKSILEKITFMMPNENMIEKKDLDYIISKLENVQYDIDNVVNFLIDNGE